MKKRLILLTLLLFGNCHSLHADTLTFGITVSPDETALFKGVQDIADAITKDLDTDIKVIHLPTKRAELWLKNGILDGDMIRVDGLENTIPGLIKVEEPIALDEIRVYSNRTDIDIDGWQSLKPYKIVYVRGTQYIANNLKPFHQNLYPVDTAKQAFLFLAAGRADALVTTPAIGAPLLNNLNLNGIKPLFPPVDKIFFYIYVLPKHKKLAQELDHGLKQIKNNGIREKIDTDFQNSIRPGLKHPANHPEQSP